MGFTCLRFEMGFTCLRFEMGISLLTDQWFLCFIAGFFEFVCVN